MKTVLASLEQIRHGKIQVQQPYPGNKAIA